MGERQEGQAAVSGLGDRTHGRGEDRANLGQEVRVREHAALGPTCGAGGVDERREVGRADTCQTRLQFRIVDVGTFGEQRVDRVRLDLHDTPQRLGHADEQCLVARGLDDGQTRLGVLEDPADLLGRRRIVDRHRHRTGRPDRVVEQRPLVTGRGQQRHTVARADSGSDQALGDAADLFPELTCGHTDPFVAHRTRIHHSVRGLLRMFEDRVDHGLVLTDGVLGRGRVLTH